MEQVENWNKEEFPKSFIGLSQSSGMSWELR